MSTNIFQRAAAVKIKPSATRTGPAVEWRTWAFGHSAILAKVGRGAYSVIVLTTGTTHNLELSEKGAKEWLRMHLAGLPE